MNPKPIGLNRVGRKLYGPINPPINVWIPAKGVLRGVAYNITLRAAVSQH